MKARFNEQNVSLVNAVAALVPKSSSFLHLTALQPFIELLEVDSSKIGEELTVLKRVITRAHFSAARGISSRAAEFGFLPRNLSRGIHRGIRLNAAEFDVFHSNNYFFTENDLKVAPLQVC